MGAPKKPRQDLFDCTGFGHLMQNAKNRTQDDKYPQQRQGEALVGFDCISLHVVSLSDLSTRFWM